MKIYDSYLVMILIENIAIQEAILSYISSTCVLTYIVKIFLNDILSILFSWGQFFKDFYQHFYRDKSFLQRQKKGEQVWGKSRFREH